MHDSLARRLARQVYIRSLQVRRQQWPYPLFYISRRLRTRHARSFGEKIQYKMIRDRRTILVRFADKVGARDYVAGRVGSDILTTVYSVANDPSGIDWSALPAEYVCKVSHGCGGSIIVTYDADPSRELPSAEEPPWEIYVVHPDRADVKRIASMCRSWMSRTYGWGDLAGIYEWAYKKIEPRVLVEELLRDELGGLPQDYRFFVFNGKCGVVQVDSCWVLGETRRDFLAPDWTPKNVSSVYPRSPSPPPRPRNLERMVDIAEELARDIDFVRVDLYDLGDRVVFGELTSYPVGGNPRFEPASFGVELGSMWELPQRYRAGSGRR